MKSAPIRGTASAGSLGKALRGTCEVRRWVRAGLCVWAEGLRPEMLAGADQEALVSQEGNVAFIWEVDEALVGQQGPSLSVMDAC